MTSPEPIRRFSRWMSVLVYEVQDDGKASKRVIDAFDLPYEIEAGSGRQLLIYPNICDLVNAYPNMNVVCSKGMLSSPGDFLDTSIYDGGCIIDVAAILMQEYSAEVYRSLTSCNNTILRVAVQTCRRKMTNGTPYVYIVPCGSPVLIAKKAITPETTLCCTRGWLYWTRERWNHLQASMRDELREKLRREFAIVVPP